MAEMPLDPVCSTVVWRRAGGRSNTCLFWEQKPGTSQGGLLLACLLLLSLSLPRLSSTHLLLAPVDGTNLDGAFVARAKVAQHWRGRVRSPGASSVGSAQQKASAPAARAAASQGQATPGQLLELARQALASLPWPMLACPL